MFNPEETSSEGKVKEALEGSKATECFRNSQRGKSTKISARGKKRAGGEPA